MALNSLAQMCFFVVVPTFFFLAHQYFNAPVMTKSSHFSIQSPGMSLLYTGDVIWLQLGQRCKDHLLSPTASDCLRNANKATHWYYLMLSSHWSQHKFWNLMAILSLKVNVQVIQNTLNFFRLSSRWRQNFFSSHRPHLANEMHYFWTTALNDMTWLSIFFFSSALPIKMFQIDAITIAWVLEWSRAIADP